MGTDGHAAKLLILKGLGLLSPSPQAESPAQGSLHERRLGAPSAQVYQDVTGCQATLLSTQARVVELESQVSPIASPGGAQIKKKKKKWSLGEHK